MFGRLRRTVWKVTSVMPQADGMTHVTVVKEDDRTDMRTFSAPALMDRSRFSPMALDNG